MGFIKSWMQFLKEVDSGSGVKTRPGIPRAKEEKEDNFSTPYKPENEDPKAYAREQFFGKNPDDLQCVKDLRSPEDLNPMAFYRCMISHGYNKIDAGSFRAVFTMPDNSDVVLKIVGPANTRLSDKKRSMEMNKKEAEGAFQTSSELVPKVFDSARDYFWIISEKVVPIKTWREMQAFFPAWKNEDRDEFSWWFQQIIAPDVDKRSKEIIRLLNIREKGAMGEKLINDPLILQVRDLLAQFDLPAWDIRPHNVGYANRNGKKQFVILDPGFELGKDAGTVKDETPASEMGDIMDIFKDLGVKDIAPSRTKDGAVATTAIEEGLKKNWQLFLENKGPNDFLYDIASSSNKKTITLLDSETKKPVESKKEGTNAYISMEKRTNVPNWEVSWSASPFDSEGVGTIMYLMALELAEEGLSPDSYETSPDALRIWEKFMKKNEYGVEKELKDGHDGESEEDPFNFVFFKPKKSILGQFSDKIIEKEVESEEKDEFDPEKEEKVEHFNPEQFDWEDLDDIDELYEQLTKDEDTNMVSKVIITDDSGKILILKRSDEGNMWDLPGGHLKKGENPEAGAYRETKEETNLDISGLNTLKTHENTHFFKCGAPKGDISLQNDEHTDFMWANPKEIDKYDMKSHLKDAISHNLTVIPVIEEQNEPYQRFSRGTYKKFITKLASQGLNKYNVGGRMKKASAKHIKSGPGTH
jgi:uncharacterized membrane-anchored protein YhcB (DUF1043 family)